MGWLAGVPKARRGRTSSPSFSYLMSVSNGVCEYTDIGPFRTGGNAGVPPADQRGFGFARKKDGNFDGLAIVDIGAFER